jgi:hypothetical protein
MLPPRASLLLSCIAAIALGGSAAVAAGESACEASSYPSAAAFLQSDSRNTSVSWSAFQAAGLAEQLSQPTVEVS